ncbi:MAG TPA: AtpZ/AtpI family protein [Terracidiphilus sp.]|nr:AtpZ/AtpI family protein [Terracidiphilus sp.]
MPFNRPIPDSNPPKKGSALVGSIVQAEKMIQVALVLPCAAFIGWLGGAWLDSVFHQKWMVAVGILVGCAAGLSYVIKFALSAERNARPDGNSAIQSKDKNE